MATRGIQPVGFLERRTDGKLAKTGFHASSRPLAAPPSGRPDVGFRHSFRRRRVTERSGLLDGWGFRDRNRRAWQGRRPRYVVELFYLALVLGHRIPRSAVITRPWWRSW